MTKTFCDRCGSEGKVQRLNLTIGSSVSEMGEFCERCVSDIQGAFRPIAREAKRVERGNLAGGVL